MIKVCKVNHYINIINNKIKIQKLLEILLTIFLGEKQHLIKCNLDCNKSNELFATLKQNAIKDLPPQTSTNSTTNKTYKNNFVLKDTICNEIIFTAKSLVSKKPAGLGGISTVMLKYIIEAIAMSLTKTTNKSLHNGVVSIALKMARVSPILILPIKIF